MTERTERFHVDLDATPDQVWQMLTTAEGLASWFGTRARIDLRVGGDVELAWGEDQAITSVVADLQPPRRLRLAYVVDGQELGAEEWLVTTDDATTRLTLVHSMPDDDIDDWEGFYGDVRRGWRLFLTSLRIALETTSAPLRTATCRFLPSPGPREPIWDRVHQLVVGSSAPGQPGQPEQPGHLAALLHGMEVVLSDRPHSLLLASSTHTLVCDLEGAGDNQVLYLQPATHQGDVTWNDDVLDALERSLSTGTTPTW